VTHYSVGYWGGISYIDARRKRFRNALPACVLLIKEFRNGVPTRSVTKTLPVSVLIIIKRFCTIGTGYTRVGDLYISTTNVSIQKELLKRLQIYMKLGKVFSLGW
jgi:hypothetical protein